MAPRPLPADLPTTLGTLRASGHEHRSLKTELRENLVAALREGRRPFDGIVGYDDTVVPAVERAVLAGHDFMLLGERGQGKTRLMRTLTALLDEWTPVIAGSPLREHPYDPITPGSLALVDELGDELPVSWLHRSDRYVEKLATPDTSVGDLIGDVDPVRLAEGRSLGDPETIHYGLLPRAHRGIVGLNELPDLAERIQVGLFNVLEERDLQVRGYTLRLPLDVFVVGSANPEDYTNRGRIITPLKDRFGAEIRTHYLEPDDEIDLVVQEADLVAQVPRHLVEVVAYFVHELRGSSAVDQRSGVSARFAVAAVEGAAASALRRSALTGEDAVARVGDLPDQVPALLGKIEFEMGEEGREHEVLDHLLRVAVADVFRRRLRGVDLAGFVDRFGDGEVVETGPLVPAADLLERMGPAPGLAEVLERLGEDDPDPGVAAAAVELVLEGLHLTRRLAKDELDDGRAVYGRLSVARRRYGYGAWRGGGDPLEPPFDVRAAVEQIGDDVMAGSSVRDAIDRLLRRGTRDRAGLDRLREQLRERRDELRRRGDLAGTLDRVRAALDQAMAAERDELARADADDDAAALAQMELDTVPDDVAQAVQTLDTYAWRSDEARQTFESVRAMLRREVLDARFAGMKQALENPDPEAMQRVRAMLSDLNDLLAAHARQQDTTEQFDEFMAEHGEFFPEQPRDTDDLIDLLARRQAAAERMMRSLSPDQRDELMRLMQGAMDDAGVSDEMGRLSDQLSALRPGMMGDRSRADIDGDESLGYGDAVGAVADLADLERLDDQLAQDYPGAGLDDVDLDALERQLAPSAAHDVRALRDLERELERQGYVQRDLGDANLTPKAVRQLGEGALRRIFARLEGADRGHHDDHRSGAANEPTGAHLPWSFGDERPLDAVRTVTRAASRSIATGGGVRLEVDDFVVAETERRTTAAVALCVDLSYSMVQQGRWAPMKQTAVALSHLIASRYRSDALQVIGFGRRARVLGPTELLGVEPTYEQGTNLHEALVLAGRHVRRHPEATPIVLVVTDGEPTAHTEPDGEAWFDWPTSPQTLRATIGEVDGLTRSAIPLNFFLLGDDPGLARFVDAVARRNGGRVFSPEPGRLGEYVVADYLRSR